MKATCATYARWAVAVMVAASSSLGGCTRSHSGLLRAPPSVTAQPRPEAPAPASGPTPSADDPFEASLPVERDLTSRATGASLLDVIIAGQAEGQKMECSFDKVTWTTCQPGVTQLRKIEGWSALSAGSHELFLRRAGSVQDKSVTLFIRKYNSPPQLSADAVTMPHMVQGKFETGKAIKPQPAGQDADGDALEYSSAWSVEQPPGSGQFVPLSAAPDGSMTLAGSRLGGKRVQVAVTAKDRHGGTTRVVLAADVVSNAAPQIAAVSAKDVKEGEPRVHAPRGGCRRCLVDLQLQIGLSARFDRRAEHRESQLESQSRPGRHLCAGLRSVRWGQDGPDDFVFDRQKYQPRSHCTRDSLARHGLSRLDVDV